MYTGDALRLKVVSRALKQKTVLDLSDKLVGFISKIKFGWEMSLLLKNYA